MINRKFRVGFVATIAMSLISLVSPVPPVLAAGATLTSSDVTVDYHLTGSAYWGGNTSPVMSKALATSIKPYNYGAYVLIWNFSNPNKNPVAKAQSSTYLCASPTQCTTETARQTYSVTTPLISAATFTSRIELSNAHKRWVRVKFQVDFKDGTKIEKWSNARYYISDAARNELPKPSVLDADNSSVPPNTAMTMTFNQWSGLADWDAGAQARLRSIRVLRCSSRPTDGGSVFVSNAITPTGCTRLVSNPILEAHDGQAKSLSFTSGAVGTFIYAIDTLAFNNMPENADVVYLQKRSIYATAVPASPQAGTDPGAGATAGTDPAAGATVGTTPAAGATAPATNTGATAATPLEVAGINTSTASVVTAAGQVTVNGITLNLKSKTRFKRSKTFNTFALSGTPQVSTAGKVAIALVKKKKGADFVYKKASKRTSKGKTSWKWNFSTKLPAGRYRLYVTFTPTDTSLAPITLTRIIRLL